MATPSLPIELGDGFEVRQWRASDAESLVKHADSRAVWRNLRDGFPHPYTPEKAQAFLAKAPPTFFCIASQGQAIGGIGFSLGDDVERFSAELGYWLGEEFWGRGVTTRAVRAVCDYALKEHKLVRVYALPFAWNVSSHRVLEKCGFLLEGRLRKAVFKDGEFVDQLLFAYVTDDV